jgi:hypothetical protein
MRISGGRVCDGRFERIEPRCHICRDEKVRVRVNELLDWHGVPIPNSWSRGQVKALTYSDILREVNSGRDKANLITLASLKRHVKFHYDIEEVVNYWAAQMEKKLESFLDGLRGPKPTENL